MALLLLALGACELELTLTAGAIGLGLRRRRLAATVLITGLISVTLAAAILGIWALWFVAPACVTGAGACAGDLAPPIAYLAAGAFAQWAWMLAVSIATRSFGRDARNRENLRMFPPQAG